MIKLNFPRGLKYRIERTRPGIIIPGSGNEPIITIYGHGIYLQYRLISFTPVEETYKGDLSDDEKTRIEDEIQNYLQSLLSSVKVKHFVKFVSESPCYYDFGTGMLCGASGVREKKGAINGAPFEPSQSAKVFIDILTGEPNVPFDAFLIGERAGLSEGSIATSFGNFQKLDPSIRTTFSRSRSTCVYKGNAQTWMIGKELEETSMTLAKIFKTVGNRNIVAILNKAQHQFNASLLNDVEPDFMLCFLGLNAELFDPTAMDVERFVMNGYCNSVSTFNALLRRYSNALEAVWNQIIRNITENLLYSLRASSYYEDTEKIPLYETDLRGYSLPLQGVRWENSLKRICPSIKEVLQETQVGADFFGYCDTDVNTDKAIGYIAALVLASFCYCQTETTDEENSQLRVRYQQKLQALIREKFDYNPPSNSGNRLFDPKEFQKGLQLLLEHQERVTNDGQDAYAAELSIIINQFVLSYNDDNSLLPPSMNREL